MTPMRRHKPKYKIYLGYDTYWVLRVYGDHSETIERFDTRYEAERFIALVADVNAAQSSLALH